MVLVEWVSFIDNPDIALQIPDLSHRGMIPRFLPRLGYF
jgi:hypothetical protein